MVRRQFTPRAAEHSPYDRLDVPVAKHSFATARPTRPPL